MRGKYLYSRALYTGAYGAWKIRKEESRVTEANKGGRPLMYKTAEVMQEAIDLYFLKCDENKRPYTITGLALALGFTSRQALLNYQGRKEFVDTITRAKARVEAYAEESLYFPGSANGAKFSLANNFEGWKEKKEIEADVKQDVTICIELTDDDDAD